MDTYAQTKEISKEEPTLRLVLRLREAVEHDMKDFAHVYLDELEDRFKND